MKIDDLQKQVREHARLIQLRAETEALPPVLRTKIEKMISIGGDQDDEKTLQQLSIWRTQLELCPGKLKRIDQELAALNAAFLAAFGEVHEELIALFEETGQRLLGRVAELVHPVAGDADAAQKFAATSPALARFRLVKSDWMNRAIEAVNLDSPNAPTHYQRAVKMREHLKRFARLVGEASPKTLVMPLPALE